MPRSSGERGIRTHLALSDRPQLSGLGAHHSAALQVDRSRSGTASGAGCPGLAAASHLSVQLRLEYRPRDSNSH